MRFAEDIESFRSEVRDYVRTRLPDDIRSMCAEERMDLPKEAQRRWHRILAEKGWAVPTWPVEHGGPGWSDEQHYVFEREVALADAPRSMVYGTGMLGPTIIEYGTERQKREILPRIVSGDDFWCQGFSEPGAGSDLASLKCQAERKSDRYVINGSKIWTSEANIADRMFGLFRTDSSGKKQYGITFLLLDMTSAGVEVRPIQTFDGGGIEINQVFFTDVEVPVEDRVGEEHEGWGLAKYLLSLERFGTAEVSRSLATLDRLKRFAANRLRGNQPLIKDPEFAARLTRIEIELRAVELTELRLLFGDGPAGAEASLLKLKGTEVQNDILELLHDAVGPHALMDPRIAAEDRPAAPEEARYAARAHFNFRKTMIYAGSNEIQRNIMAKAVLGL
ncbi:MAG: acyl-CoA dehydrogenase family protein [Pseudomonadota bacterium]